MSATETKKNEYCQISIPKDIKADAEKAMSAIGCRTMTSFASMAIKEYIRQIQTQNQN